MDKSDGSSTSRDPTILCILFSYFFFLFLFFFLFVRARCWTKGEDAWRGEQMFERIYIQWLGKIL